jgi:tyrosyl-tRNA synthetase
MARVGTMIAKESVRKRMDSDSGISFTEFSYQLLQGYDFVHLRRAHGVRVQVGGSDQWGNITAGTDLIRRMLGGEGEGDDQGGSAASSSGGGNGSGGGGGGGGGAAPCFGATFPLLLKADGTKFGKSEGGAVWLAPAMLSPYQFYQHLLKTTDADAPRFLRILTFLPLAEIDAIEAAMAAPGAAPNAAQRRLAEEVTRFVHGEAGLAAALRATAALAPGADTALDAAALEASDAPTASLPRAQVVGCLLAEVMVAAGMQPSKAAVRRMIKGGGVSVNNAKVGDEGREVTEEDLIEGRLVLIAAGKKNKMLVRVEP